MSTFLLVVAALVGTLMLVLNPFRHLLKKMDGRKGSELQAEVKEYIDKASGEEILKNGCKWGCFVTLSLLFTFVIEPIAVLSAISGQTGNQPLAYVMLAIIAVDWIRFIRTVFFSKNANQGTEGTIVTTDGTEVQGTVVNLDKEIHLGNPVVLTARTLVSALPTLYLWYLFGIAIHLLPA